MVVDKTANAKEQDELKSMTHNQFCEHLAMALINNNSFITQEGPLHPVEEDQKEAERIRPTHRASNAGGSAWGWTVLLTLI
jgi:hypothetical protein